MESVRPDNTDPIPLRRAQQGMGSIMIRFVGLLLVSVAVLAMVSRPVGLPWLANRDLSADERGVFERIAAVGIAPHDHRSGQHHGKRDGREDKADKFQVATIRHGRPLGCFP
jgi:hypothetical protein